MPKGRAVIGLIAVAGSGVLTATGVEYALHPNTTLSPPEPVGWWLATLAFLGAIALVATGVWQWRAAGGARLLFLILIAGLSGIWVAASSLGILTFRAGPPDIPRIMHWIGLAVSTGLFLGSLGEATAAVLGARTRLAATFRENG